MFDFGSVVRKLLSSFIESQGNGALGINPNKLKNSSPVTFVVFSVFFVDVMGKKIQFVTFFAQKTRCLQKFRDSSRQ